MIPNVDEKILSTEFDMKNIGTPKPEAPWIKRCDFGIKFTDEIQMIDNPIVSDTETSLNKDNNHIDDDEYENDTDSINHNKNDKNGIYICFL
jgi:hypothetical protein